MEQMRPQRRTSGEQPIRIGTIETRVLKDGGSHNGGYLDHTQLTRSQLELIRRLFGPQERATWTITFVLAWVLFTLVGSLPMIIAGLMRVMPMTVARTIMSVGRRAFAANHRTFMTVMPTATKRAMHAGCEYHQDREYAVQLIGHLRLLGGEAQTPP